MNERIRLLRKNLGLNQTEFGKKLGLKQNAVSLMEKVDGRVTDKNVKAICTQFSVHEEWLRTGEGAMFVEDTRRQKALLGYFAEMEPAFQDYLIEEARRLLELQAKLAE